MKTNTINLHFLITCFLILLCAKTHATHMMGSDMEFKYLAPDSYRFTLRIYRDCSGIPINSSPKITFVAQSPCNSITRTLYLTRKSIKPVPFLCNSRKTICEGGTFPYGAEEHMFEVNVNLQQLFNGALSSSCCWIKVIYQECCRNSNITNLAVDPLTTNYYISGLLNRCVVNSSPTISSSPISVICAGQPLEYNNGFIDYLENDSLSYEWADPMINDSSGSVWVNGFDKNKPLNFLGFPNNNLPFPAGFHLNKITGDIRFTPTGYQLPVFAIEITEWRKINGTYVKISATRRDVQFFVIQCANNFTPELSCNGSANGPFNYSVCAGSQLCLKFVATDKDTSPAKRDTTNLTWNKSIPGATFTSVNTDSANLVQHDTALFCWTPPPTASSSLPYYFLVTATDNNCPAKKYKTTTFGIQVKPLPISAFTPLGNINGRQVSFNGLPANALRYHWDFGDTLSGNNDTSSLSNPTHTFSGLGQYQVTLRTAIDYGNLVCEDRMGTTNTINILPALSTRQLTTSGIEIYPNPSKEGFIIELPKVGSYQCMITDISGKQVLNQTFTGVQKIQVERSNLKAGIYLVRVSNQLTGEESRQKLVLE